MARQGNSNQTPRAAMRLDTMNSDSLPVVAQVRDIDAAMWNALKTSIFPGAQDQSVALAVDYCEVRSLDVMQKPVHIVPMWIDGGMRDVVMPGIGLYRIQAQRSGTLAGMDEPEFGPMVQEEFTITDKEGRVTDRFTVSYPEFCTQRLYKIVAGQRVMFAATVYWREEYATASKWTEAPNSMWRKRCRGQIAKVAEAAALRKAFPEVDQQPTFEEMEGKAHGPRDITPRAEVLGAESAAESATDKFKSRHKAAEPAAEAQPEPGEPSPQPGVVEAYLADIAEATTPPEIRGVAEAIASESLCDDDKARLRSAIEDRKAGLKAERDRKAAEEQAQRDAEAEAQAEQEREQHDPGEQEPAAEEGDPLDDGMLSVLVKRMAEASTQSQVLRIMAEGKEALGDSTPAYNKLVEAGDTQIDAIKAGG